MLIKGIFVNQNQLRAWLQNSVSAPEDDNEKKSLKAKVYNNSPMEFRMIFHVPKMKVFRRTLLTQPLLQFPWLEKGTINTLQRGESSFTQPSFHKCRGVKCNL